MRDRPDDSVAAEDFGGDESMTPGGRAAGRSGVKPPVRRGGRPPKLKSGTGPKIRAQFHISAECNKRLGVHSVMSGQDKNELVETLLMSYLLERGQGQEAFQPDAAKPPRSEAAPEKIAVADHIQAVHADRLRRAGEARAS